MAFVMIIVVAIVIGGLVAAHVLPSITPPSNMTSEAARSLLLGPMGVAMVLLGLPAMAAFIYVAVRLSLTAVVTAAEGRIGIARSWSLAGGILWPLFLVALVGGLLTFGAGFIGGFIGGVIKVLAGGSATRIGGALGGGFGAVVSLIFGVGALSQVYQAKRGVDAAGGGPVEEVFS